MADEDHYGLPIIRRFPGDWGTHSWLHPHMGSLPGDFTHVRKCLRNKHEKNVFTKPNKPLSSYFCDRTFFNWLDDRSMILVAQCISHFLSWKPRTAFSISHTPLNVDWSFVQSQSLVIGQISSLWSYLIFVLFRTLADFKPWKFSTQKCVILRKKLSHDKTA